MNCRPSLGTARHGKPGLAAAGLGKARAVHSGMRMATCAFQWKHHRAAWHGSGGAMHGRAGPGEPRWGKAGQGLHVAGSRLEAVGSPVRKHHSARHCGVGLGPVGSGMARATS
jgi:hypothetical protein